MPEPYQLPTVQLNGRNYFYDERLEEFRNCEVPWIIIKQEDYDEAEAQGHLDPDADFIEAQKWETYQTQQGVPQS